MTAKAFAQVLPFVRCFNMLNYADAVRKAAEKKDRERLDWLRLRLAGELDLVEA